MSVKSKNKNQNNFERIIANVKWGFPSPNSDKPKRYITLYLGNNKLDYKDKTSNYSYILRLLF